MDCLAPDTVAAFVAGRLEQRELGRVELHVHACASCLDLLSTASGEAPLKRGAEVGRYVILNLVGRGGMAEVYAAYDPKLDRRVAVKLLRSPVVEEDQRVTSEARLSQEAQAIGRLSHPNVVAAYDAGTHDERVFIAMEFVDGETLADWLRRTPRRWNEIRDVFAGAARGLAAAHAAGLVHRDFKPPNVMVGRDGQARVTDFGLARRLLAPEAAGPATPGRSASAIGLTRTGALLGTPVYMAPEQFQSKPADARSDQFSFCVALFEALYGQRPFAGDDLTALKKAVIAGQIRFPAGRHAVPPWLRRAALRGLSVAPEDRFPTMTDLLDALEHRRPRSHRVARAAGLTLAALLAGGLVVNRIGDQRVRLCRSGGARVAAVWDTSSPPAPTSRRAATQRAFLATGLPDAPAIWNGVAAALDRYARQWTDAYTDTCEATNVRGQQSAEILDLRMTCLNERLDQLRSLADVFTTADASMLAHAAEATSALAPLARCADVALLRSVVPLPLDERERAAIADLRNRLAEVKAQRDAGRIPEARRAVSVLETKARALGYQPALAETLALAGWLQFASGESQQAQSTLADAIDAGERAHHDETVAEAAALLGGAISETAPSLQREAERWLKFAEAALDRMGPAGDRLRSWVLTERAVVLVNLRDFAAASSGARAAIALKERLLGPNHPDVAHSLVALELALVGLARPAEALEINDRSLRMARESYGNESSFTALCLNNRGEELNALGRYREAKGAFEGAIARWTGAFGPDHRFLGYALTGLGQTLLATGDIREAVSTLERALVVRVAREPNVAKVAETRLALARARWAAGQRRQARAGALEGVAALSGLPPETSGRAEIDRWLTAHPIGRN